MKVFLCKEVVAICRNVFTTMIGRKMRNGCVHDKSCLVITLFKLFSIYVKKFSPFSNMKSDFLRCEHLQRQFYQCRINHNESCKIIKTKMEVIPCSMYGFDVSVTPLKSIYNWLFFIK